MIIKYTDRDGYNHTCLTSKESLQDTLKEAIQRGADEAFDPETGDKWNLHLAALLQEA